MPEDLKTDDAGRPIVDPDKDNGTTPVPTPKPAAAAGAGAGSQMSPLREKVATWTAVGVIVALGVFYIYMLIHVGDEATQWARRMILLSGVEAIVFAAAGFLFGKSVQREAGAAQVKNLEKTSEEKSQEAARAQMRADLEAERAKTAATAEQEARVQARGGEMLVEAVLAKAEVRGRAAPGFGPGPGHLEGMPGGDTDEAETGGEAFGDLEELRRLAEKARGG